MTGTKGKGSTACLCEAVLRRAYSTSTDGSTKIINTGLFTSPHLVDIRERIRVNGAPVSRQVFGEAYWEVRRRLERAAAAKEDTTDNDDERATTAARASGLLSHAHPPGALYF